MCLNNQCSKTKVKEKLEYTLRGVKTRIQHARTYETAEGDVKVYKKRKKTQIT